MGYGHVFIGSEMLGHIYPVLCLMLALRELASVVYGTSTGELCHIQMGCKCRLGPIRKACLPSSATSPQ
jgi:hypothetical protein